MGLKDLGDEIRNIKIFGTSEEGKKKKKKAEEGLPGMVALASKDGRPLIEARRSPDRSAFTHPGHG